MHLVDEVQLVHVEDCSLPGNPCKVEHLHRLVAGEDLPLVPRIPPEQRKVVEKGVGVVAHVPVFIDAGRAVTLGEFLFVLAQDHGQMGEGGDLPAQSLVEQDLLRGVGDVVLSPYHVADLHGVVIDYDGVVIGGEAVALYQDNVLEGVAGHLDVPVDHVVEGHHLALWDGEDHRFALAVGLPRAYQLHCVLQVDVPSLRLPVGTVVSAQVGALVPVEAEPQETLKDRPFELCRGADQVGVLNAQYE